RIACHYRQDGTYSITLVPSKTMPPRKYRSYRRRQATRPPWWQPGCVVGVPGREGATAPYRTAPKVVSPTDRSKLSSSRRPGRQTSLRSFVGGQGTVRCTEA